MTPSPADWTLDPIERARFLDGEGTPAERAARRASLDADPVARARIERDARFLEVLRSARDARERVPPGLDARVRSALAADRARGLAEPVPAPALVRPRARVLGLAAAAAAAIAIWLGFAGAPESHAADEATLAAEAARRARDGRLPGPAGATCEHAVASPYRFPLVANGELRIAGCRPTEDAEGVVSVVGAMDDRQASRGLVSMRADAPPAPASGRAPDVGVLTLDDMVVFDVSLGGVRYTLAAPRDSVERLGRCAACHNRSHEGQANPHRFRECTR